MSHIPASAMPHTRAEGDTIDGQPPQAEGERQEAEPNTATPLTSEAPATATGNREGGVADRVARAAGEPKGTAATDNQPAVDGTVKAQDDQQTTKSRAPQRSAMRSEIGMAAFALGGLAIAGGIAAALYPRSDPEDSRGKAATRQRKGG